MSNPAWAPVPVICLLTACSVHIEERAEPAARFVGYNADMVVEVVLTRGGLVGGGFAYLKQPGCVWRWHGLEAHERDRFTFFCMVGGPSKALPMEFEIKMQDRSVSRVTCEISMKSSGEKWFSGSVFAWDWAMPEDYDPVDAACTGRN